MIMSKANIKISSSAVLELKKLTGETTGQKAVEKALIYFLSAARQRKIIDVLSKIKFSKNYNPIKLRKHDR